MVYSQLSLSTIPLPPGIALLPSSLALAVGEMPNGTGLLDLHAGPAAGGSPCPSAPASTSWGSRIDRAKANAACLACIRYWAPSRQLAAGWPEPGMIHTTLVTLSDGWVPRLL